MYEHVQVVAQAAIHKQGGQGRGVVAGYSGGRCAASRDCLLVRSAPARALNLTRVSRRPCYRAVATHGHGLHHHCTLVDSDSKPSRLWWSHPSLYRQELQLAIAS